MVCWVPVETRPTVTLVNLNEGVSCGVGDGAALDLTAIVVLVPRKVVNARTRDQSRIGIVLCVFNTCTVLSALFDLIYPKVVDSATAGIVELP